MDLRPEPIKIKAQFDSICEICSEEISEGDEITQVDGEWVHYQCADEEGYL